MVLANEQENSLSYRRVDSQKKAENLLNIKNIYFFSISLDILLCNFRTCCEMFWTFFENWLLNCTDITGQKNIGIRIFLFYTCLGVL